MTDMTDMKGPSPDACLAEAHKICDVLGDGLSRCDLIQFCGSDDMVAKAARISTDRETVESGKDKLIRYLARHKHETPFEHSLLTFRIVAPLFVVRQWQRHRIGWSYNEQSRRYTSENLTYWAPGPDQWRTQAANNRQCSTSDVVSEDIGATLTSLLRGHCSDSERLYRAALEAGASREQARAFLPVATYTAMYATCNLRSLVNFWILRSKPDAQPEIKVFADRMAVVAGLLWPISWPALAEAASAGKAGL